MRERGSEWSTCSPPNGYDADANEVEITVNLAARGEKSIVVQDSGTGMTLDDITGKWLELATDSRRRDRTVRTKRYHRLALGEKGVGRIAVDSLTVHLTGQPVGCHLKRLMSQDVDQPVQNLGHRQFDPVALDIPIWSEPERSARHARIEGLLMLDTG